MEDYLYYSKLYSRIPNSIYCTTNFSIEIAFLHNLFLCRLLTLRHTRAGMQAGQGSNASMALREASASITMMALVIIYVLVHGQTAIWWVIELLLTRWAPTSPAVLVFYNLSILSVVWTMFFIVICLFSTFRCYYQSFSITFIGIWQPSNVLQLFPLSRAH